MVEAGASETSGWAQKAASTACERECVCMRANGGPEKGWLAHPRARRAAPASPAALVGTERRGNAPGSAIWRARRGRAAARPRQTRGLDLGARARAVALPGGRGVILPETALLYAQTQTPPRAPRSAADARADAPAASAASAGPPRPPRSSGQVGRAACCLPGSAPLQRPAGARSPRAVLRTAGARACTVCFVSQSGRRAPPPPAAAHKWFPSVGPSTRATMDGHTLVEW
jgi:hypothetical protein